MRCLPGRVEGRGAGEPKMTKALNKKLRNALCKFLLKFLYETGPQTIFQGSSPRAALIRFSKLFRWSAFMRAPATVELQSLERDPQASKLPLNPRPLAALPPAPSRPSPSPVPSQPQPTVFRIPENPKIVWGEGGGGGPAH